MTHSRRHITLSMGPRTVSVCETCLDSHPSHASAARAAYAAASRRAGGWPPADYTGVRMGLTTVPPGARCDLDERPPADPQRDQDYAGGRFFWVCAPATPGAQAVCQHSSRLTIEGARDFAERRYGHRRDLTRCDVRIERDGGALQEYAGPVR